MTKAVNPATDVVLRAQHMYPKALKSVVAYFGPVPYGKVQVDPRTADRRLLQMQPEQMAQLAATDPQAALAATARIKQLETRVSARPAPPTDDFQP